MSQKTFNKEIEKAARVESLRTEIYFVKKWQAVLILAFAAIMVVGIILQAAVKNKTVVLISLTIVLIGALAIVAMYIVLRVQGVINYNTYFTHTNEGDVIVQVIGKRCRISNGIVTLETDRRSIYTVDGLYRPEFAWDWFREVDFTSAQNASVKGRKLFGERNGKRAVMNLRDGALEYGEVEGIRMRYYPIKPTGKPVLVRGEMYDAAVKAGIAVNKAEFITRTGK